MSLVKKLLLKKIESHNSNRNLRSLMSKREIKTFQFLLKNFYNYQFNSENKTKVLDVGCADKFLEKSFLEKNISYTGIDIVDCDLNKDKINFPDNTFDYIVCLALVEHISNTENMFNEFNRVLKKEGILIREINYNKIDTAREHWPFLRDRRVDFYKGILKNPEDD